MAELEDADRIRYRWQPWMGRYFGWHPWTLEELTPMQLKAALADVNKNPGPA